MAFAVPIFNEGFAVPIFSEGIDGDLGIGWCIKVVVQTTNYTPIYTTLHQTVKTAGLAFTLKRPVWRFEVFE